MDINKIVNSFGLKSIDFSTFPTYFINFSNFSSSNIFMLYKADNFKEESEGLSIIQDIPEVFYVDSSSLDAICMPSPELFLATPLRRGSFYSSPNFPDLNIVESFGLTKNSKSHISIPDNVSINTLNSIQNYITSKTFSKEIHDSVILVLENLAKTLNFDVSIEHRVKDTYDLYKNLVVRNVDLKNSKNIKSHDVNGYRVILDSANSCYAFESALLKLKFPFKFKYDVLSDFVMFPKHNNFQFLRFASKELSFEIQIMSKKMYENSKEGFASNYH